MTTAPGMHGAYGFWHAPVWAQAWVSTGANEVEPSPVTCAVCGVEQEYNVDEGKGAFNH